MSSIIERCNKSKLSECETDVCNCPCLTSGVTTPVKIKPIIFGIIIPIILYICFIRLGKFGINLFSFLYKDLVPLEEDIDPLEKTLSKKFIEAYHTGDIIEGLCSLKNSKFIKKNKDTANDIENASEYAQCLTEKCFTKTQVTDSNIRLLCGCIPIADKYIKSFYLSNSIGLAMFLDVHRKNKTPEEIEKLYNIKNLYMGDEAYKTSQTVVKFVFKILAGLIVYILINITIIILTLGNIIETVSGSSNIRHHNGTNFFTYSISTNSSLGSLSMIGLGFLIIIQYWLIPLYIYFFVNIICRKMGLLKYITDVSMFRCFFILAFVVLIFFSLRSTINLPSSGYLMGSVIETAKNYFNDIDKSIIDKVVNNITIRSSKSSIWLMFLFILILCLVLPFLEKKILIGCAIILIILIIILMTQYFSYQFTEPYVKGAYTVNDDEKNPYVVGGEDYVSIINPEFMKTPVFNLTSAYLRMNYCCLPDSEPLRTNLKDLDSVSDPVDKFKNLFGSNPNIFNNIKNTCVENV